MRLAGLPSARRRGAGEVADLAWQGGLDRRLDSHWMQQALPDQLPRLGSLPGQASGGPSARVHCSALRGRCTHRGPVLSIAIVNSSIESIADT